MKNSKNIKIIQESLEWYPKYLTTSIKFGIFQDFITYQFKYFFSVIVCTYLETQKILM